MNWIQKILARVWSPLHATPAVAGDKEVAMSDTTTTATPPAASGAPPLNEAAIAGILEKALKPFAETLTSLQNGLKAVQEAKHLTAEDVTKAVQAQLTAARTTEAQGKAREAFVAEQLKGVPAAYHAGLGNDPAKWAEEAKTIREGFTKDLAALGVKPAPVTTEAPGGQTADKALDLSKLTGAELIALGVKQTANAVLPAATAVQAGAAPAAAAASAAPAAQGGGAAQ